jgi:hypothetical protein
LRHNIGPLKKTSNHKYPFFLAFLAVPGNAFV